MKCKIADCLSILVSLEKKQRIRKFIFKTYDLSLNQYVLKGLATVFSLGSLRCEFQIFLHFIISGRVLYHVICQDLLRSYNLKALSESIIKMTSINNSPFLDMAYSKC